MVEVQKYVFFTFLVVLVLYFLFHLKFSSLSYLFRYLLEHPEYVEEGVTMSQFSFQIPKPLQENYVRKRPPRVTDGTALGMSRPLEPSVGLCKNLNVFCQIKMLNENSFYPTVKIFYCTMSETTDRTFFQILTCKTSKQACFPLLSNLHF